MVLFSTVDSVTSKNLQMSIKVAQNDFTRKIEDFDSFTNIALECRSIVDVEGTKEVK